MLNRVILPTPYGDVSTDFDVLLIQQLMLNTDFECMFIKHGHPQWKI